MHKNFHGHDLLPEALFTAMFFIALTGLVVSSGLLLGLAALLSLGFIFL